MIGLCWALRSGRRVAALAAVFVLATVGVAPVPVTPLGLALWCASTLVP